MRRPFALFSVLLALLAAPALAGEYEPGTVPPEPAAPATPSGRVLHAGRGGIQRAVDRARPGDTIRLARRTYRGDVEIRGASKRGVRLAGAGARLRGTITVRDTGSVTLRGLTARGVRLDRVDRYTLDGLRVSGSAGAGIDVRRSTGGAIRRVRAWGNRGPGIALRGAPARVRTVRTFIRESTVERNAVGIALDGAGAVTVDRVRVQRNAAGISATGATDLVVSDSVIEPPER
jgi:hypothetical protein